MADAVSLPAAEFSGRRILITGAAGSIGSATARLLAEAGAELILSGRDAARLEKVAADLPGGSATIAVFDLAAADAIPGWIRELAEKGGPLAGIAHTAGIQINRALKMMTAEFSDAMLHANVTSAIMLAKGLRQRDCHAEGASLVLLSSAAARIGGAGNVAYASSKGAIIAAASSIAHELLRDKIRVNCVVPGLVESDMAARSRAVTPPESWNAVLAAYPLGIGHPDDVAHGIVYLLSRRSRWITGTDLRIDGGLSIV
ncbi:MAG: SDR family oxidoreductase [Alphaproteobacteria bacterium]